jgi:hypothetical protein
MNTVWVLIALVSYGYVVPAMEFTTQQKCEAAIQVFKQDGRGQAIMRCVKVEK